jgi:thiol-disulfide isomerase/thioredoxin
LGKIPTQQNILPKGLKMQFKTIAVLSILSLLFFNGCDSKESTKTSDENESTKQEVIKEKTNFTLSTIDNKQINIKVTDNKITLENNPEKIVLLNFFATWCPPCKAEIPNLIKLQNDYKNDLQVISILLEDNKTNESVQAFINEYNINYEITNSSENFEFAKSLGGIKSIPTMYLVSKDSSIFQKYVGLVPSEMMEIDIKKLLSK